MANILIAGGSGLVGRALSDAFIARGDVVFVVSRKEKEDDTVHYVTWSDLNEVTLPRIDLIINLAGATLNKRWTNDYKKQIISSRLESTEKLVVYANRAKPSLFISASAVGYYPTGPLVFTEEDTFKPHNFLSDVVYQWEQAALELENDVPLSRCRFGVVLAKDGGALPLMAKPYQFGVGGDIAGGQQYMSWIHIKDLVKALLYIYDERLEGVYNCTSPEPVTQHQFGKALSKVLHRPHWTSMPSKVMYTILGEQADMVTKSQCVLPKHLQDQGFVFDYPNVYDALENIYS